MRLKPQRRSRKSDPAPDPPGDRRRAPRARDGAPSALARTAASALGDVAGIVREMLVWPVRLWLGAAEVIGAGVLAVWRAAVLPALRLVVRVAAWALRFG